MKIASCKTKKKQQNLIFKVVLQVAAILIHLIGPLFCLVLAITTAAEYGALVTKHGRRCDAKGTKKIVANGDSKSVKEGNIVGQLASN